MALKNPKRLVIDASVARAAGGRAALWPSPVHCRDFLMDTNTLGHFIVMTIPIQTEWNNHASPFSLRWLTQMESRGRRFFLPDVAINDLRDNIMDAAPDEGSRDIMLKDVILIEAAIATDELVASLDETARRHYRGTSRLVAEIQSVVWVNPSVEEEEPIKWLREGANPENHRMLGYQPPLA